LALIGQSLYEVFSPRFHAGNVLKTIFFLKVFQYQCIFPSVISGFHMSGKSQTIGDFNVSRSIVCDRPVFSKTGKID
jgi:hypothetical protein